jgi:hypothetical protein
MNSIRFGEIETGDDSPDRFHLDMNALVHGLGDWQNMQDVVRKAFQYSFESQKMQAESINKLCSQVSKLKEELKNRPSWEDVDRLVDLKLLAEKKKTTKALSGEIDQMKLQIAHLRTEMEKKVSVNYLEMSLNKKMDKSEVVMKDLTRFTLKEYDEDMKKVRFELTQLKSDVEHIHETMSANLKSFDNAKAATDIALMKAQIESIVGRLREYQTREEVNLALNSRVRCFALISSRLLVYHPLLIDW